MYASTTVVPHTKQFIKSQPIANHSICHPSICHPSTFVTTPTNSCVSKVEDANYTRIILSMQFSSYLVSIQYAGKRWSNPVGLLLSVLALLKCLCVGDCTPSAHKYLFVSKSFTLHACSFYINILIHVYLFPSSSIYKEDRG